MKEYLTARDIEDLVSRGVREIALNEDIIFTDLARDRAMTLGVTLIPSSKQASPQSVQPPNISKQPVSTDAQHRITTISLPMKPNGCLHSHLETASDKASGSPPSVDTWDTGRGSRSLIERLVDAVRRLSP